jgi:putative serine protease PepD
MSDSSQLPRLICSDGKEILVTGQLIFGRSPECSVHLDDNSVSRQHTKLELVEQRVMLSDLGSRNGTWLNDQKITTPMELHNGDRLRISKTIYIFKAAAVPVQTVVPPIQNPAPVLTVKLQAQAPAAPVQAVEPPAEVPASERTPKTVYWQTGVPMTLVRSDNGAEFGLNRSINIGRDESNDLALKDDTSASSSHARIELVGEQVVIADLKSRNGTWVNGKRIQSPMPLKHGDRIRVGNAMFRLRVGERSLPPLDVAAQPVKTKWQKWGLPLIGVSTISFGAIAILLLIGIFLVVPQIKTGMQATARQRALRALVVVIVPVGDIQSSDTAMVGSGSLLNKQGYVLTNYHVLADIETGVYYNSEQLVLVGLNWNDPEGEPDTFYQCRIVELDQDLDLALLQVTATANGDTLPGDLNFPFVRVGNSDTLGIGNQIIIIGFPSTGGSTPTFTNGVVSGFYPDGTLDQGWIKTDAEISEGNSGGMAINQDGKLIGVPTIVVTGERTSGKIGYVRPINLALSLIQNHLP